ncbi:NAD(P)H-hydrate dehydratase [Vibrio sp. S4M6]|uniref:NAD(P)H-hydrate dehydratase n=1 Tax=Vibrio sinus TaxID=2946865 RepID=UPI002029E6C1|nr:NAD(P)H-hydrate dehydratase [Vibrio sinus]MCL9780625.1 NAD(P)H-hydrate dehydratase [Vibrio sinus]
MSAGHSLPLYSAEQVKQGEVQAAKLANIPMYDLMEKAGAAVFETLLEHYGQPSSIAVFCGGGNNGGDGYVVARLAKERGIQVSLYHCGAIDKLKGDALTAKRAWQSAGGRIVDIERILSQPVSLTLSEHNVVVDALLGTGLSGPVRPQARQVIALLNQFNGPVVSVDIPSGLCANTGQVLGDCVKADHTVTFIGHKQGLVTGHARAYTGDLHFAGLSVEERLEQICATSRFLMGQEVYQYLPERSPLAHKGNNGKLICIGGNEGMAGAIVLASTAAARSGAGLVATLAHSDSVLPLQVHCPEVMARQWCGDKAFLSQRLRWSDVVLIGPGLGTDDWSEEAYHDVLGVDKVKVFDADALNLLAQRPNKDPQRILTPHSGEAARLLGVSIEEVESDRYQSVIELHQRYGGVIVLKGPGTLVFDGQTTTVCPKGNSGMASGGMGDVLSGVIAGLLAQGMCLFDAAKLGVYCHSEAADVIASQTGQRGMLASDVIPQVRALLNRH